MDERIVERRMNEMKRQQSVALEEYGWFAHYVLDHNGDLDGMANLHTHGIWENFGHRDLQVVLPIQPEVVHGVFANIVAQIQKGRFFQTDKPESKVLENFEVHFREFEEHGRKVLRLILPDPSGKFPWDEGCESPYSRQTEELRQ